ncbi:MAG: hypothetical protein Q8S15_11025 [Erysipelotrichaceae bacterium]|nr:hypothetical protein [Erysipelotrichaceae bacterium]
MRNNRNHFLIYVSIAVILMLIVSGCSKKPGNDLLNMKFTKVYVGGWMMETADRVKPLAESDRKEITQALKMDSWTFQKDFSINTLKPIIVLYDDSGAKVSVSEYEGKALVYYVDASSRNREYYFASGDIIEVIQAFNARIEPDLVVGDNDELPEELLSVWFLSAYVGLSSLATEDKWFVLKQEDSLYIRAMMDLGSWTEAKDLAGFAFETYYMLKGEGGWMLSVGVLQEKALVSIINPTTGFTRKVYYAPISILGEVEEVLRRISPVVEIEVNEFINANLTRAYVGDGMAEWDEKWFDLSELQASDLRSLLRIEDWIIAQDLPAVGLDVLYSLSTDDGIDFWVSPWDEGRALVGVTVSQDDVLRREFYYAPSSIILDGQNMLALIRPASKYPVLSDALRNVVLNGVFSGVWTDNPDDFVDEWSPITLENSAAVVFTLTFDSWIVAENLPPMGIKPQFMVRSADGIQIFGTYYEGKSLIGVTNSKVDAPGEYYFAPDWVVEFTLDYLNSLGN